MANRYAVSNGNWSDTAIWDGGTLPIAGDVVRPNTYVVTIDQDIDVSELRNDAASPAAANGHFEVSTSGLTIVADVRSRIAAGIVRFTSSSGILTIIGDLIPIDGANGSSAMATAISCVRATGAVTINVIGNVYGEIAGFGIFAIGVVADSASSIINVTGSVQGGKTGGGGSNGFNYGIWSAGSVNVTGNVSGGTLRANNTGIVAGSVAVTGNIAASLSVGVSCTTLICTGNVTGTAIQAVVATSTVSVTGDVSAGISSSAINSPVVEVNGLCISGSTGYPPIYGGLRLASANPQFVCKETDLSDVVLSAAGANQAATTDVRFGVSYGGGTGSLRVPDPSLVALGVLTDDTTGTYAPAGGLDEAELHDALDSYTNKDNWKATGFATPANLPAGFDTLTITDGKVTAELDSSARVKLHADQPDYAPAKSNNVYDQVELWATDNELFVNITNIPKYGDVQRHTQEGYNLEDKSVDILINKVT